MRHSPKFALKALKNKNKNKAAQDRETMLLLSEVEEELRTGLGTQKVHARDRDYCCHYCQMTLGKREREREGKRGRKKERWRERKKDHHLQTTTSLLLLTRSCLASRPQNSTLKVELWSNCFSATWHSATQDRFFSMKETSRSNTNTGFPIYKM